MPKPWAKYVADWINHPKFEALSANAICLWIEMKSHSDVNLTDGIVPAFKVKQFRFYSAKAMESLLRSAGPRPNGEPRKPLVEPFDVGGVAHVRLCDYLEHNDCRDKVIERITDAEEREELRRLRDKERKQRDRDKRQNEIERLRNVRGQSAESAERPRTFHHQTETETETEEKEKKDTHTPRGRERFGPTIMGNEHRAHAACGRICVPAFLHREFRERLGGDERAADDKLRKWYDRVMDGLPPDDPVPSDAPKFWRPLFDAEFVTTKPSVVSGAHLQAHVEGMREILRKQGAL